MTDADRDLNEAVARGLGWIRRDELWLAPDDSIRPGLPEFVRLFSPYFGQMVKAIVDADWMPDRDRDENGKPNGDYTWWHYERNDVVRDPDFARATALAFVAMRKESTDA